MYTVGVPAFKCAKGLSSSYLSDRFETRSTVHDPNTRNKDFVSILQVTDWPQVNELFYRALKL